MIMEFVRSDGRVSMWSWMHASRRARGLSFRNVQPCGAWPCGVRPRGAWPRDQPRRQSRARVAIDGSWPDLAPPARVTVLPGLVAGRSDNPGCLTISTIVEVVGHIGRLVDVESKTLQSSASRRAVPRCLTRGRAALGAWSRGGRSCGVRPRGRPQRRGLVGSQGFGFDTALWPLGAWSPFERLPAAALSLPPVGRRLL